MNPLSSRLLFLSQTFFLILLFTQLSPLFGALYMGPEKVATVTATPSNTSTLEPHAASTGSRFLIVWQEDGTNGEAPTVFGSVIDNNGGVIEEKITICEGSFDKRLPCVTSDGSDFLVAWTDFRFTTNYIRGGADIFAARVTSEGAVLDPNGFKVTIEDPPLITGPPTQPGTTDGTEVSDPDKDDFRTSASWNGKNYLVVWIGSKLALGEIRGARISPDGTVLDRQPIPISGSMSMQFHPLTSGASGLYFVAWNDTRTPGSFWTTGDLVGTLLDNNGKVLFTNGLAIASATNRPTGYPTAPYINDVSNDGTNFIISYVWMGTGETAMRRIRNNGAFMENNETLRPGSDAYGNSKLARTPTGWISVWSQISGSQLSYRSIEWDYQWTFSPSYPITIASVPNEPWSLPGLADHHTGRNLLAYRIGNQLRYRLVDAVIASPEIVGYQKIGNRVKFSWVAQKGVTYQVQSTTSLQSENSWKDIGSPTTAEEEEVSYTNENDLSQSFYRVVAKEMPKP